MLIIAFLSTVLFHSHNNPVRQTLLLLPPFDRLNTFPRSHGELSGQTTTQTMPVWCLGTTSPPSHVASSSFKNTIQGTTIHLICIWTPRSYEAISQFLTDNITLLVKKFISKEIHVHFILQCNELILCHSLSISKTITLIQSLLPCLEPQNRLQIVAFSCNLSTIRGGSGRTVLNRVPWFIFWKYGFWPYYSSWL